MLHKIIVSPEHLPILKNQLHTVLSQLLFAEIIPDSAVEKNTWLSICAQAIGYKDWEDLKA
ncbi:hypothetical protein [Vibrio genomosp. F6]|nr:hypothetical protein [Vibrio genomosp. F6]